MKAQVRGGQVMIICLLNGFNYTTNNYIIRHCIIVGRKFFIFSNRISNSIDKKLSKDDRLCLIKINRLRIVLYI